MQPSVIIPAYFGDAWLPECIATLAQASRQRLHLILVDNHGNTCINSLNLSAFDAEILRCPRPMGFADANNFALLHSSGIGDCVLFLNQDIRSTPGWLDTCLAYMEENPSIAALSPLILDYDLENPETWFLECAARSEAFTRGLREGKSTDGFFPVPLVPAAALLVRSDSLLASGPFDPLYGSYYEDYDLCQRLARQGGVLGICGSARVGHYSGSASNSPEAEIRRGRNVLRNRVIHETRHGSSSRPMCLLRHLLIEAPRQCLRALLRRPGAKPLRAVLSAHAALLRLLPRLVSAQRDAAAWQECLRELDWPAGVKRRTLT